MKRMRIIGCLILILAVLTGMTAAASANLSAIYDNGTIRVSWNAEGECVLTVYRDGWPMTVCSVMGEKGGASIAVGALEGSYSVRLKTGEGCYTAKVSGMTATAAPEESQQPTSAPVETEVPQPTPEATIEPTAVPPVVTEAPEITATPIPTAMPTATPGNTPGNAGGQSVTSMAAQVISAVNEERAAAGLPALTVNPELTSAACVRAQEIVEKFSHTRPDGSSWSTISSSAFGENIAKGQKSAERVMAAWMSSDGHRANILRESFGSIGVCALKVDGVIYWVQLFGR